MGEAGNQALESSSAAFQAVLTGSWTGRGAAGLEPVPSGGAGVAGGLMCYVITAFYSLSCNGD